MNQTALGAARLVKGAFAWNRGRGPNRGMVQPGQGQGVCGREPVGVRLKQTCLLYENSPYVGTVKMQLSQAKRDRTSPSAPCVWSWRR